METTRRKFLKLSGLGLASVVLADLGCVKKNNEQVQKQQTSEMKSNKASRTFCCACSTGWMYL